MKKKVKKRVGIASESLINSFYVVEAYKTIRTNLQFTLSPYERKIVVMTSAEPSAGKSTTVANLAVAFGQAKNRVLLVDADLRKSTQHRIFKVPNLKGLSDVLGGFSTIEEALQKDVKEGVDLVTAGTIPPNPSELLGSVEMRKFLNQMWEKYDYILVDAPPVCVVTDALTMISDVAGYVFVARQGLTGYTEFEQALQLVRQNGGAILGSVITNVGGNGSGHYYRARRGHYDYRYRYHYYGTYGTTPKARPKEPSATTKAEPYSSAGIEPKE